MRKIYFYIYFIVYPLFCVAVRTKQQVIFCYHLIGSLYMDAAFSQKKTTPKIIVVYKEDYRTLYNMSLYNSLVQLLTTCFLSSVKK